MDMSENLVEEEMKDLKIESMCDLGKKEIEKHFKQIVDEVKDSKYICLKCARTASKKDYLCKPKKI